jgi:hypothetical protein
VKAPRSSQGKGVPKRNGWGVVAPSPESRRSVSPSEPRGLDSYLDTNRNFAVSIRVDW